MILQARVRLQRPRPEQDAARPGRLEAGIGRRGRPLRRRSSRPAVAQADAEPILARRRGQDGRGLTGRGTTPSTFKTALGTVHVRRRRLAHRADGTTEVAAAHARPTPRHLALTPGLRHAAGDGMLRDSARPAAARIDTRAGASGGLAQATVPEIVHPEGQQLRAAAHARAAAVYGRDAEALPLRVPATAPAGPGIAPDARDDGEGAAPETATPALIGFAGGRAPLPEVERDEPRRVGPDVVVVERDEVKVPAQAHTARPQIRALTAVGMSAGRGRHLAAATAQERASQVGAPLAVPGVHRGARRPLVLADGARWIRDGFEGLGLEGKALMVCWWHLVKRVEQDLSRAGCGREHRRVAESAVLPALWHARVEEALGRLRSRSDALRDVAVLGELIGSLEARRPDLPGYAARPRAGLWIARHRAEEFDDWSVSARCKPRGRERTEAGAVSWAVPEAARRNGELPARRATHRLPARKVPRGRPKVA